jgi:hypothetical protein
MRLATSLAVVSLATTLIRPAPVQACGGFFCSSAPVDQSSERIIFAVNADGTTDMIVQIAYQGDSDDFAWLLPLAEVPDPDSLATFPELAMMALDSGTGPSFVMDPNCQIWDEDSPSAGGDDGSGDGDGEIAEDAGVSVYIRETVGPYDVAVIGSDNAEATSDWLQTNGYRISGAMNEYVKLYTAEHMKFLALKLTAKADVSEIAPFRLSLKGETPNIPLRLTSIAAVPEMGVVVWIFADQRFAPGGEAREITIDESQLRWGGSPDYYNYKAVVARAVDAVDGRGFVVDQAGSTENLQQLIVSQELDPMDPNYAAQQALKELIQGKSYMTRLYTRLSPEEMSYDPLFVRSKAGDVSAAKQLPYVAELCDDDYTNDQLDPCDFGACGAQGLCRKVTQDDGTLTAACACAPGLTARSVVADDYSPPSVSCVDERMSFLNPGQKDAAGNVLPDPCAGFSCGEHGSCVSMNMTPTCECQKGYVADARREVSGPGASTSMRCVLPSEAIPETFYKQDLKPITLPTGRDVHVVRVKSSGGGGLCSLEPGARSLGFAGVALGGLGLLAVLRRRKRRLT